MFAERVHLDRSRRPQQAATSRPTTVSTRRDLRARRPGTATCSTPTCRSASACARTARSTASSTRRTARARTSRDLRDEMRMRRRPRLRLRLALRRRRHADHPARRARRDDRPRARALPLDRARSRPRRAPTTSAPSSSRRSTGRVQRLSCGVQSFDDRLLRQMDRYGKYGTRRGGLRARRGDGRHVPLVQRRHDLQLPEPDRGDARCATSSWSRRPAPTRRRSTR